MSTLSSAISALTRLMLSAGMVVDRGRDAGNYCGSHQFVFRGDLDILSSGLSTDGITSVHGQRQLPLQYRIDRAAYVVSIRLLGNAERPGAVFRVDGKTMPGAYLGADLSPAGLAVLHSSDGSAHRQDGFDSQVTLLGAAASPECCRPEDPEPLEMTVTLHIFDNLQRRVATEVITAEIVPNGWFCVSPLRQGIRGAWCV